MKEEDFLKWWYRLRGLGLTGLCAMLFFVGVILSEREMIPVSSTGNSIQYRKFPISCVQTEKKQIALSFDTEYGTKQTETILKILEQYEVKASFFLTGSWAEAHPEEVKWIAQAGHDLGNHSQSHKNMTELTKTEMQQEIRQVHETVRALTGAEMNLFRVPYGDYDPDVLQVIQQNGYLPIQWNVDTEDWKNYGVESILKNVLDSPRLGNGSIILMHNEAEYLAMALERMIPLLQEQGYELVPVSQLVFGEKVPASG